MLTIALCTLRRRWVSFAGTFVALTLGVGLIAAMGLVLAAGVAPGDRAPQRFGSSALVVAPTGTLTAATAFGPETRQLAESPGLDPKLVADVARVAAVAPDRSFYAQPIGAGAAGDPVGHGWSSAAPTGYRLAAGSAPARDTEIVVAGGGARPGDRVRVRTVAGLRAYTVSGVVAPRAGAAAATGLGLAGLWVALLRLVGPTAIVMPWGTLAAVTVGTAALAVLATLIPVCRRRRGRARRSCPGASQRLRIGEAGTGGAR